MKHAEPHDPQQLPTRIPSPLRERLWLDGDPTALSPPLVALVGTREPDAVASALARRIAADLARAGVHVLSGGALGVDAAAHRGALLGGGRTVVVLPSGLAHWYPKRHEGLYREVIAAGGALVSQFPPETPPTRWTFPRRNELVASLADVVVVVQASASSGALLTAAHAQRLGRRVMAVPAAPGDRRGAGCVRLLLAGALPCADADDVLATLGRPDGPLLSRAPAPRAAGDASPARPTRGARPPHARERAPACEAELASLDGDGRLVYDNLSAVARHVDELSRLTGLPAARLQRALTALVLAGLADDRGAGRFARG